MDPIPEALVERTWKEVAQFTLRQIEKEHAKLAREQKEVLGFVLDMTADMGDPAKELAVYLSFVVVRMFQKAHGPKLPFISSSHITDCYEANTSLMEQLNKTHERFLDRIASLQILDQAHVMKYVVEALVEEDDEEDFKKITEDDKEVLFWILKAVVDALSKAVDQRRESLS